MVVTPAPSASKARPHLAASIDTPSVPPNRYDTIVTRFGRGMSFERRSPFGEITRSTVPPSNVRAVTDEVLIERRGAVARLVINRPDRRNALNAAVLAGLRSGLAELKADDSVRVVVMTGAGERAF